MRWRTRPIAPRSGHSQRRVDQLAPLHMTAPGLVLAPLLRFSERNFSPPELFFLAFPEGLAQLAAAAVADVAREAVAAKVLVVAVVEQVDPGSSYLLQRLGERREVLGLAAQRADELA